MPPPPHPHPGESEHDAAVRYIKEYVTNNYVDDRDTNIDNSVNQQIHTDGGDVDQIIRTTSSTASGDGAVSAAGNIDHAAVTTGDDNQIGENNIRGDGNVQGDHDHVVSGDHNTTAFGSGAANSATIDHASVDGGGALSVSGPATADQHNSEYHQVSDTSDTTKVDVDHSFNDHADTTTRLAQQRRGSLHGRLARRRRQQRAQQQLVAGRTPGLTLRHRGSSLAAMRRRGPAIPRVAGPRRDEGQPERGRHPTWRYRLRSTSSTWR